MKCGNTIFVLYTRKKELYRFYSEKNGTYTELYRNLCVIEFFSEVGEFFLESDMSLFLGMYLLIGM